MDIYLKIVIALDIAAIAAAAYAAYAAWRVHLIVEASRARRNSASLKASQDRQKS